MDVQHGVWNGPYRCGWFWWGFSGSGPSLLEFTGWGVTLSSAGFYDLDTKRLPDAAVVKVMSISDNHCIRVLIPDENVGRGGSHDVLLHDMAEADSPYVVTSDLMALRLD